MPRKQNVATREIRVLAARSTRNYCARIDVDAATFVIQECRRENHRMIGVNHAEAAQFRWEPLV